MECSSAIWSFSWVKLSARRFHWTRETFKTGSNPSHKHSCTDRRRNCVRVGAHYTHRSELPERAAGHEPVLGRCLCAGHHLGACLHVGLLRLLRGRSRDQMHALDGEWSLSRGNHVRPAAVIDNWSSDCATRKAGWRDADVLFELHHARTQFSVCVFRSLLSPVSYTIQLTLFCSRDCL